MIVHHYGILLILGVSAFVGLFGAWFFQKIKVPQVVGYITVGLLLGQSGIGLVDKQHIAALEPFTFFALGMIGFLVGGELKISEFRKYGRQFFTILMGEGVLAFILVGTGTTGLFYLLSGNLTIAIAGGIVLGAIASATDPASTIDVLWEYRSKGVVTTALIAIVALDDALAMALYSLGKSVASLMAGEGLSLTHEAAAVATELGGAIAVAAFIAFILRAVLLHIHNKDKALAMSICTLFLVIGISVTLKLDVILASMTLGFGLSNLLPKRSEELFHTARSMSIPIYVLFFVLVGARFNLVGIPSLIWGIAGVYIVGRSVGKFVGTLVSARVSKADKRVEKFAGLGLFAQGGVAIGLAIVASRHLQHLVLTQNFNLADCVIAVVTATTIAVQLIGPIMTKLAIKLAGEIDKNITQEDLMRTLPISDIMLPEASVLKQDETIEEIIEAFSSDGYNLLPVTDKNGVFCGVISFASLREALPDRDLWRWVLASDIMDKSPEAIGSEATALDAMRVLGDTNQDVLLVMNHNAPEKVVGIIESGHANKVIKQRLLEQLA
ncbi:MAG: cation:proton antiporter [Desulfobacterales bacterium]